jgi:HD-GYP domain-containing protein (c-di-GMP phosphodiesterase class II)
MGARVTAGVSLLKNEYFRVPVNLYQPGDLIEEDIYFLYQGNYLLYRLKNLIWKAEDQQKLSDFNVESLYIRCESERDRNKFLETKIKSILDQSSISTKEKAEILYHTSKSLLEELYERPDLTEIIRRSMNSIQNSISFLSRDKKNFFELMSCATAKFSEFSHGLHVAAYAIMLAKQTGIRAFNQISAIGIASMLHDIGKSRIDSRILEKQEALTIEERKIIEKHPLYSYEIAHKSGIVPPLAEMIILQHHEHSDGRGYPTGISQDLHAFSRIVSLCDEFDLLTSDRPYKKAFAPLVAIEQLRTKAKDEFDHRLLVDFIKMLRR